jgi:hypothetical protein
MTLLRFLALVLLGTTFGVFFTRGLYRALRRGIVSSRSGTFRRSKEPFKYWFTMTIGVFALLFVVIATFTVAFRIAMSMLAFGR